LKRHCPRPGPWAEIRVCWGAANQEQMMVLEEEGGKLGPFSPLRALCVVLGRCCLAVGCLEGSGSARGATASCGRGRASRSSERLPNWLLQNCFLMRVSCFVCFCARDGEVNRRFSISCVQRALFPCPALRQSPPGDGGCWGSRGSEDVSTGLAWLALNRSKTCGRNIPAEEGEFLFFLSFVFFKFF